VVGGANGAGKTTLVDFMPDIAVGERLDPDAIARRLSPRDPALASIAAGRAALARIANAVEARRDLTVETTLSGRQAIGRGRSI
jgi:predicted ABC-type ATPase